MTFKVGDKVVNSVFGPGEIVYGPYDGTHYFMKGSDGGHHTVSETLLRPAAKFSVGDTVEGAYSGSKYTIEAGPFFSPIEWYATKDAHGNVGHNRVAVLRPVAVDEPKDEPIKVGDVVRVPMNGLAGADVKAGDLLVVRRVGGLGDLRVHAAPGARQADWYFQSDEVERIDADKVAVHDNVAYELGVKYLDSDRNGRDAWRFERRPNGEVRGTCDNNGDASIGDRSTKLADVVNHYGPLTRA
ncbi:phiSA1p31-related protein [Streptomyces scabiei]|uniref:phiSA1p31-related protein n=1 Tax=Streptomyces scabiei TaxID=1930 RepID=UPI0029A6E1EF|nr:phiSA1p31-related protein [Streptomyces scabiei]MDX2575929.1 phiSA1p31-related protein [Streptomyces scabiei]MDX2794036.1 phiSA1p31-related protein [Streptomyces scabiei]MDX2885598.1 phiSA1p31-related protein [Streptomyces scabiei]MDX2993449.1 phiSA1p31-related protein [Streptomyces scabiei]MDX3028437.1 phiSA1p31-related protein [Streptomyces scabiei]